MTNSKRTITKVIFLAIFILTAILNISFGQPQSDHITKAQKIDELISTYAEYGKFNGSVLVAEEGEIIYKKGFGMANMEWDIPNQPDTKFRIASITKQFTAMLIVQLAAENKLDLHQPISTYLPDYPKKNADIITIHHLLTHTSGIPEFDEFVHYRDIERNRYRPEELMEIFAEGPLEFTPGSTYKYSNPGYVVLGVIIEKITGNSYENVLQEKIFKPLQMNNTGYDHHWTVLKNRASGYSRTYGRGNYVNVNYIDMSIPYAAGSIYSTVEDLYLWDQALYSEKVLPKKYLDLLFKTHIPARDEHYGYGWFVGEIPVGKTKASTPKAHHGGGIHGFNTRITRIPSNKSLIILLNNTERAPLHEMTIAINGILHDKPYNPKKSIAYSLQKVIDTEGVSTGIEYYKEIKGSDDYYLDENEMNIAGYELLLSDKLKKAALVLKLNVEAFPNSSNAYDSYGEILLLLGNKAEAIENYTKSVALNPENQNGVRILKKLGVDIIVPKKEDLHFLEADSTWGKEIFTFPISFAPAINYKGVEDIRFPVGWGKKDSSTFWSYVFAWDIDLNEEITTDQLENDLKIYFDGLMKKQNTVTQIIKTEDPGDRPIFTGKVETYDNFHTKKRMTLNVLVEQYFCKKKKRSIILFRFSPKAFGADVWQKLNEVKVPNDICDHEK